MKRIAILLVTVSAVVLMSLGNSLAQPPERGPGGPGQGRGPGGPGSRGFGPPPNPIMEALDADRDGELSAEEIQNAVAALKKLDKNNDGKLTQEEVRPARPGRGVFGPGGPGGGPNAFIERVKSLDENKDGKITKEEMPERMQQSLLARADTNEDGAIDEEELKVMAERIRGGGPAAFIDRVKSFDENKDGKITKEEMPERMQQMLERIDTNKDGAIDEEELKAVAERFGGRGAGEGRRGGGGNRPQRPE